MNLNSFFNQLAANSSRNFKIEQLENHRENGLLRNVVRLALDPFTNFYIRKIPKYSHNALRPVYSMEEAFDTLFQLSNRDVTGNAAIELLAETLGRLDPDDAKVVERIIEKDLKCGVSVATANAVWTGLVHEYPCMLCSPYEQKLIDKIQFPAIVQKKEDGMRFNAIVRDGKVEFRSRNGKEINLLGYLEDDFACIADGMDCVFDGELLVINDDGFCDRQTGNGILNKATKGTIKAEEAAKVHAQVWDMIPYMYFIDGECPVPYKTRLQRIIDKQLPDTISIVETQHVDDLEQAQEIFQQYLADGFEGIILKDANAPWENKRAKHQIKFKGELECDLKVVDWIEGTGKNVGRLGALVLESGDGVVKVGLGTGFNDADRASIVRENSVGRIVAVKYNARITDKRTNIDSLFLPRFIEFRSDKDYADTSDLIK